MPTDRFATLAAQIGALPRIRRFGRIAEVGRGTIRLAGGGPDWRIGDRVAAGEPDGARWSGEIVGFDESAVVVMADAAPVGVAPGDRAELLGAAGIAPDDSWLGRVIDPYGQPLDGRQLHRGPLERALRAAPPEPAQRRRLGRRLETGLRVFNTLLPLVRGQRLGIFAGSGVGKSTLMGHLARNVPADVAVIALIGERGRELREFVESVLGPAGLQRAVVVAATSDQSPLTRRRCAWAAMAVAEHFRDRGQHVLFLADSITRLAEAHREVALAAGEPPSLRGFPPSTAHLVMALAERAGPGHGSAGDITALFTVLVAGSDMDEPVADILRGVLDGHVVMDRRIAERGRFPAIDLLRSVSRSLPEAADARQNGLIAHARRLLGAYEHAEMMIRAGLYMRGTDPQVDAAVRVHDDLDRFLGEAEPGNAADSFDALAQILARAGAG